MRKAKGVFVILIASISLTLPADGQGQALAAEEATLKLEDYGIELTLPARWTLREKGRHPKKAEHQFKKIGAASDVKGYADVVIYTRKGANITLRKEEMEEIFDRLAIHKHIKRHKKRDGYTSKKRAEKQLKIGSGETVNVEYWTLSFGNNLREVILAHFSHKDNSFCSTIFNTSVNTDIEKLAEEVILPAIKLF